MEPEPDDLARLFRARLESELVALRSDSQRTSADRRPVVLDQQSVGRLSRMDALQMQAMAKAAEERRGKRIARIESALARLDEGEFGYCAGCGGFIGMKRLKIDPVVLRCVRCA